MIRNREPRTPFRARICGPRAIPNRSNSPQSAQHDRLKFQDFRAFAAGGAEDYTILVHYCSSLSISIIFY